MSMLEALEELGAGLAEEADDVVRYFSSGGHVETLTVSLSSAPEIADGERFQTLFAPKTSFGVKPVVGDEVESLGARWKVFDRIDRRANWELRLEAMEK